MLFYIYIILTLPKYFDLPSFTFFDDWIKNSANGMNMFTKYWLSYVQSFLQLTNSVNAKDYANLSAATTSTTTEDSYTSFLISHLFPSKRFIDASNSELKKQLRSKDFLQNFKNYVEGIANLDSIQKQSFGYSYLSNMDSLIDQALAFYSNNLVSINQTPNKVIAQIGKTRIIHYFSDSNETNTLSSTKDAMPLLMVYAPINRYHILDLSPNRSIVNKFVCRL